MKAHSVGEFLLTLIHCLQWPNYGLPGQQPNDLLCWMPLLVYAPFLIFVYQTFTQPAGSSQKLVLVGVGAWVIFQSIATAYARSMGGAWPSSRYLDSLAVGLLVNGVSLVLLLEGASSQRLKRNLSALGICWALVVGQGLYAHCSTVLLKDLPENRDVLREYEISVRSYLATNDESYVDREDRPIPYHNGPALRDRLSIPGIRAVLPSSIRPPIRLSFTEKSMASLNAMVEPDAMKGIRHSGVKPGSEIKSDPFTSHFSGWLKIWVSEETGSPDLPFALVIADKEQKLAAVKPATNTGRVWRTAYLPAADEPLCILASNHSDGKMMAFSEPVEISRLSFFALQLVKAGREILCVALLFLGIITVAGSSRTRRFCTELFKKLVPACSPSEYPRPPRKRSEDALWLGLGVVFLGVAFIPLASPLWFARFEPAAWAVSCSKVFLLFLIPATTWAALRSMPAVREEKWFAWGFCLFAAVFCEVIHYWHTDKGYAFGPSPDNASWQRMLHAQVMQLSPTVLPHSYRFLPDSIVSGLAKITGDFDFSRICYRLATNAVLFAVVFRYARLHLTSFFSSLVVIALVALYPITILRYAGQLTDPLSHLSFAVCLYALAVRNEAAFCTSLIVGIFAKESIVAMSLCRLFYGPTRLKAITRTGIYLALSMGTAYLIRHYVNHGSIEYTRISGVDFSQIDHNLAAFSEWLPMYIVSLGVLVPGAVLGWNEMRVPFRATTVLLTAALVVSSLLFSWLVEVRNLVPAFIPLIVWTAVYLQKRFYPVLERS